MFKSLIVILFFSFIANADSDLYYATLVKNIKINNGSAQGDVVDDNGEEDDASSSEIPKCEEIGEVGDFDCIGRLYVSNESLETLVSGNPIQINGSPFYGYSWDKINTHHVTSTKGLFSQANVNENIEKWDVSNVVDMSQMFQMATVNYSLGSWDVSNVKNMSLMFYNSEFNGSVNNWDVSGVTNMEGMFYGAAQFNQPLHSWNVENVEKMNVMFLWAESFRQDIGMWSVCNVDEPSNFGLPNQNFPEEYLPDFGNDELCN